MQESVKQDREKYIGGSDIPVIMNLSPYKSRYDLLLEKAGYKVDSFEGNAYTEYGNKLEPMIRDYINMSFPSERAFKEGKHVREAEPGESIGVRCHTDGENPLSILEIKTTATIYEDVNEYKLYLVQLLFYMIECGRKSGLLAVYERPEDLSEVFEPERLHRYSIDIERYTSLVEEIKRAVELFKEDLEKVKANPFITEEELLPAEIPDIASRILAFEYQLKALKEIEKKVKADKARLKEAMERSGVKSWKTPNGCRITLIPDANDIVTTEKVFDIESFKAKEPLIYEQYLTDKTTVKKGKTGYVLITVPKEREG